jgi:hypothetical protein
VYLQWRAALQFRLSANLLQLQIFPPPFATLVGPVDPAPAEQ